MPNSVVDVEEAAEMDLLPFAVVVVVVVLGEDHVFKGGAKALPSCKRCAAAKAQHHNIIVVVVVIGVRCRFACCCSSPKIVVFRSAAADAKNCYSLQCAECCLP